MEGTIFSRLVAMASYYFLISVGLAHPTAQAMEQITLYLFLPGRCTDLA